MKNIAALFIIFLLAFSNVHASQIQAYLSYAVFNTPDNQPYIETYFVVNGSSLEFVSVEEGKFQCSLDIQVLFKKNDSIVNFGKYGLSGPIVTDTSIISTNLLDVQRYSLPEGKYTIELSISDPNSIAEPVISEDEFIIDYPEEGLSFSNIELLFSYEKSSDENILVKNGYNLVPYVFNYYPQSSYELSFYAELYNSDKVIGDDQFILYYYIRPFEIDKKLDQFFSMKKLDAKPVNILLSTINISQLPSGNYLLVLEARNRNNELLKTEEIFFQRRNDNIPSTLNEMLSANAANTFAGLITSRDSLILYIDYLYPISTDSQKNFSKSLIASGSTEDLQKYFYSFWLDRNQVAPEKAWSNYYFQVQKVNHDYRILKTPGYKSDRGRVYLQYGAPNTIAKSYSEPEAYPYEIWHYHQLSNGQQDKRFVYYTREIATNDFQLIHSTAMGELSNYRWQTIIHSRGGAWVRPLYDVDAETPPAWYGSQSTDYYYQPR